MTLTTFDDPQQRRPRLQQALRAWFEGIAAEQPLALAVDDVADADELSSAFVALLAHHASSHRILVATTAGEEDSQKSFGLLRLLSDSSVKLPLPSLRPADTEALLRSVFGEVPNLQHLAHRLHELSQGNPRDIMALAQHLVAGEVIRYEAGSWIIPAAFDETQLPSSMAEALRRKVTGLDAESAQLAQAMALVPGLSFDVERMARLTAHRDRARTLESLDRLLVAGIMKGAASRFGLSQEAWREPLLRGLTPERRKALHLAFAELFEFEGDQFGVAQQLLRAGEETRGLEALIEHARSSQAITDEDNAA